MLLVLLPQLVLSVALLGAGSPGFRMGMACGLSTGLGTAAGPPYPLLTAPPEAFAGCCPL